MKKVLSLALCALMALFFVSCAAGNGAVVQTEPCEEIVIEEVAPSRVKILQPVMFDWDSFAIRADQNDVLDKIAGLMVDYPDTTLILKGNASTEGAEDYNLALSTNRAEAVRGALHERGVEANRIVSVVGDGETTIFGDLLELNRRVMVLSVD